MGPPANNSASGNYMGFVHGLRVPLPPLGLSSTAGTCVCVIARLRAVNAELHLPIAVCCMCGHTFTQGHGRKIKHLCLPCLP